MFAKTSVVALFAGLAAAQHAPVGEPNGNPITRPLTEVCVLSRVALALCVVATTRGMRFCT
jgi:hypothetical protein